MGMNVNLTPQLEELVRSKVATGMYNSASEVVRDALRLMAQHDQVHEVKLEQLRQEIKLGLNSGDASTWESASGQQIRLNANRSQATKSKRRSL
jgi:antitoxin ParD1/3/4